MKSCQTNLKLLLLETQYQTGLENPNIFNYKNVNRKKSIRIIFQKIQLYQRKIL